MKLTCDEHDIVSPLHYYCYPTFVLAAVVGLSVPSALGLPYLFYYVLALLGLAFNASLPKLFRAYAPSPPFYISGSVRVL